MIEILGNNIYIYIYMNRSNEKIVVYMNTFKISELSCKILN